MKEEILFIVGVLKSLTPLIISGIAIWLTYRYQKYLKKLADDRLLKELFT